MWTTKCGQISSILSWNVDRLSYGVTLFDINRRNPNEALTQITNNKYSESYDE